MDEGQANTNTSGVGKWMWVFGFVSVFGLLALVFDDQLNQQVNPNMDPDSVRTASGAQVRLKQNRYGHYVTSGFVNGQPVVFMLDTGATSVSVPYHLATELGMQAGQRYRVSTANGDITVANSHINELRIGEIVLYDIDASLNPHDQDDEILLGMSALKHLEFTQKDDWLILTDR